MLIFLFCMFIFYSAYSVFFFLYFFVLFILLCIAVSVLFLYKFTDNCHRVETPLQLINIILYRIVCYDILYIIPYHVMSCLVLSCHVVSYSYINHIIPHHVMSYIISYRIIYILKLSSPDGFVKIIHNYWMSYYYRYKPFEIWNEEFNRSLH
jgi:hypothetical protein